MSKLIWLIWDAASFYIVQKLFKEGAAKNLKKVEKIGGSAAVSLHEFNCQTPCALAVQFTGYRPAMFGIGGYYTPLYNEKGERQLLYDLTFKNKKVGKEVLWNKKFIGNKSVSLGQIPYLPPNFQNISNIDGFSELLYESKIFYSNEMEWYMENNYKVSFVNVFNKEFKVGIKNDDVLLESLENHEIIKITKNINDKNDFWLDESSGFKFFVFTGEENKTLFFFSNVYRYNTKNIAVNCKFRKNIGVFFGVAYGRKYRGGVFGKPYYLGGEGYAEKIYMSFVLQVAKTFEKISMFLLSNNNEITVAYQPCIDEVSHEFYGLWKNSHSDIKDYYWQLIKKAYDYADDHLGAILKKMKKNDVIFITSDHGIYDVDKEFYINEFLCRKGYLKFANDKIDYIKTLVYYHPCNSGALYFNCDKSVQETVLRELLELKICNRKIIEEIIPTCEEKVFGDYFVIPADGIVIEAKRNEIIYDDTRKTGCHMVNNQKKSMQAILFSNFELKISSDVNNTDIKDIILSALKK